MVVVWCVLGVPDGGHGGGGMASWPLVGRGARVVGNRRRVLVHNARAFGPGGRWCGGMPLVPSDRRRGRRGARLWPLVGRCLVVPCDQRHTLLRNARGSPGRRGSVGGARAP